MKKMTIQECMEERITFLKNRLQSDQALLADTADIAHVADTLRRLNHKVEKRARNIAWQTTTQKDAFRKMALDSEL